MEWRHVLYYYYCIFKPMILGGFIWSNSSSWFVSTNVTRINTCCQLEFRITGYLFKHYDFSTKTETTCYNNSCINISSDVIDAFGQTYNTTKLEEDTHSARSTLTFIRASSWLIVSHFFVFIIFLLTRRLKSKQRFVLLISSCEFYVSIMTILTILSTAGVGVYSNVYRNLIGFSFEDLSSGWKYTVFACAVTMLFDLVNIIDTVLMYCDVREKCRKMTPSNHQPTNISTNHQPTNISTNHQPPKISTNNWIFLDNKVSNTVLDIPMTTVASQITNKHQDNEVDIDTNERSMDELKSCFQEIIDDTWNQSLVGKGADAKNLSHAYIRVDKVEPGHNDIGYIVGKYLGFRSVINEKMKRCGQLQYLNDTPILTNKFINSISNSCTNYIGQLNTRSNEYFLFHGTSESSADNILKVAFDINKVKRPFLGKGLYFAESPVKADQYTDASSTKNGCLLLCRVILGNFIVRKTPPGNELTTWTHLPCSRCLQLKCSQHPLDERFDSLIYDAPGRLFREFVVFNTDQILVECVIKYARIS